MITTPTPYTNTKSSNIEWLGDVPEHWTVARVRCSVEAYFNGIWGDDPNGSDDLVCIRVADFDRTRRRVRLTEPTVRAVVPAERIRRQLKKGDLLIEKSGGGDLQPVGIVILYDHTVEAVCSNFIARMQVASHYNPRFLVYLHSHLYSIRLNVRSIKQTTGIQNLDISSYLRELVAFPSHTEQTAIVHFLDHVDRGIHRYICSKQKLIELLIELRHTIIHRAVTQGLDPAVRLKPSGLQEFADIPEHWDLLPIKHWVTINAEVLPETTDPAYSFSYIDIGSVGTAKLLENPQQMYFSTAPSRARRIVRNRDTIVSTVRTYLKAVYYVDAKVQDSCHNRLICSTGFAVLTPRVGTVPRFVSYLFQSNALTDRIMADSVGIAYPAIAERRLGSLHVAVPALAEQMAIVSFLDRSTTRIDTMISSIQDEISLLREYRTRLIADVVTGKLDVCKPADRLHCDSDQHFI